jgi:hypothetical protein
LVAGLAAACAEVSAALGAALWARAGLLASAAIAKEAHATTDARDETLETLPTKVRDGRKKGSRRPFYTSFSRAVRLAFGAVLGPERSAL